MTKLIDGPAAGVTILIRRAPQLLRVMTLRQAKTMAGSAWEALDKLDAVPPNGALVYVYRRVGGARPHHVRGQGYYQLARYRLFSRQPGEEVLRNNAKWRDWANEMLDAETTPPAEDLFGQPHGGSK